MWSSISLVSQIGTDISNCVAFRLRHLGSRPRRHPRRWRCARRAEISNSLIDVALRHVAAHGNVQHSLSREHRRLRRDRAWGQCLPVMRRFVWMRHPADMHQLDEQVAAPRMDGIGDLAPTGDVGRRVDSGRCQIALTSLMRSSTHSATAAKFRIGRKPQRHGPR